MSWSPRGKTKLWDESTAQINRVTASCDNLKQRLEQKEEKVNVLIKELHYFRSSYDSQKVGFQILIDKVCLNIVIPSF